MCCKAAVRLGPGLLGTAVLSPSLYSLAGMHARVGRQTQAAGSEFSENAGQFSIALCCCHAQLRLRCKLMCSMYCLGHLLEAADAVIAVWHVKAASGWHLLIDGAHLQARLLKHKDLTATG
jgi:hypothetical protein